MEKAFAFLLTALMCLSMLALAQGAGTKSLESTLWDVDQRWLCTGPYEKPYQSCVQCRSKYWVDGFFEINGEMAKIKLSGGN